MAKSTFYYQCKVQASVNKNEGLLHEINRIYHAHKGRYGYRRITAVIRNNGQMINHKKVKRLMDRLGLKSRVRIKKYASYKGCVGAIAPHLLQRNFKATKPNQKWVTDVTEFNVLGDKLYLSPILDLFNGEIIAYQLAKRPHFAMVDKMLSEAILRLDKSEKPLLHSDQGWQYQMLAYRTKLQHHGITQSMSRKGTCLDNAVMENFFGHLKSELFYLNKYQSVEQLESDIIDYIDYYNHDRIKLKLNKMSPVQYRAHYYFAA